MRIHPLIVSLPQILHKRFPWFFLFVFLISACEKDDICNEGTPGTPRVVIRFFDNDNPTAQLKVYKVFHLKKLIKKEPI